MNTLSIRPIPTRLFELGESLLPFIQEFVPSLNNGSILAVTTKIVSLSERAVVGKREFSSKMELVKKSADHTLCESVYGTALTIKDGLLVPAAGIDESNTPGEVYILYPENPYASAEKLCDEIKKAYGLKNLGVILTDSHTQPLRRGVTGIGVAHWGFKATQSYVGSRDLFGREIQMTYVNVLDALAAAAVFTMGETSQCQPLALIETSGIDFSEESSREEIQIPPREDIYAPLFSGFL